jgi:holliday junction DNA helicase RuvB
VSSSSVSRADTLRPARLAEFSGQPSATTELGIVLSAAKARGETCDHILLAGPPGCGKTTLAAIIATELGLPLLSTSGPAIEKPSELASLLAGIDEPAVVFIDEIHAMSRTCAELLYPAMEDGVLDITTSTGSSDHGTQIIRLPLPPLVFVAATTQAGSLPAPLLDRFGHHVRVHLYETEALAGIVTRSAHMLNMDLLTDVAELVASRSRGTPRVANALLRRVRDYSQAQDLAEGGALTGRPIDMTTAQAALSAFGIDTLGLDSVARAYLRVLTDNFNGGPVGLGTLAAAIGEAPVTLEQVYEPHLMRAGLVSRTPRGRTATPLSYTHQDKPVPAALTEAPAAPVVRTIASGPPPEHDRISWAELMGAEQLDLHSDTA